MEVRDCFNIFLKEKFTVDSSHDAEQFWFDLLYWLLEKLENFGQRVTYDSWIASSNAISRMHNNDLAIEKFIRRNHAKSFLKIIPSYFDISCYQFNLLWCLRKEISQTWMSKTKKKIASIWPKKFPIMQIFSFFSLKTVFIKMVALSTRIKTICLSKMVM